MSAEAARGVMRVYGSRISYYTGKLETYLRFRSLPYELRPTVGNERTLRAGVGVVQMPVVQLADGRWMTDTTPMLAWFESQQRARSIYPRDPALRFIALLLEDYADEWLWRSAMHYRWNYRADRQHAAETLYAELVAGVLPLPRFLALRMLVRRQRGGFVRGDGVNAATRAHNDETYLAALARMQAIFERRPFLLGRAPTIADFGLMGPMLRHFGQDPTPAELMRTRAPAVYEWVARMWNAKPRADADATTLLDVAGDALEALLAEACETHLAQLRQNALAFGRRRTRTDQTIQGCHYARVPVSRYRVWCLEVLRRHWAALAPDAQRVVRAHLPAVDAAILWDDTEFAPSRYDEARRAPFGHALNVFGTGIPPR